ncbi:MAG: phenylalanine aminomutase (D-beta-phenylalanine forming) [Rhabdochlamydiaceae bacterium]|nr:phenylalanine aminomutase (D-beta-phenylalanine forming) [Candidatus Amphrikana amoebophyrae]
MASENSIQIQLNGNELTTYDVFKISQSTEAKITIADSSIEKISNSRDLLEKFVDEERVIYGVNTSMGGFVNWLVPITHAHELQENLIASVASNVGDYLDDDIVRASMLVRINSLARGCSGISIENFNKLVEMFNSGIIPCVPSKGSLGASGDLGPLAAIALVATGKWKAKFQGVILSGEEALKKAGITPMNLSFKEGLSLINGTSVMAAYGAILTEKTKQLISSYEIISCLSFEGLKAMRKPFNPIVHKEKPHIGQLQTAKNIWKILADSKMDQDEQDIEHELQSHHPSAPFKTDTPIEDAYSIRCTPHILGPIRDTLVWIENIITNEINSSNDNPLILTEHQEIFHNGHFHGQYVSMAMDYLSISLTTLSNLSDRRIDRFMDKSNNNNLPPFLCKENPGLRLGLMGGQFMATSLTAENRSLCTPLSIQSLTSTGDFQDIVSLGLVAARRADELYSNVSYIIAFELLCASQAADIRGVHKLSSYTKPIHQFVRESVPYLDYDTCLTPYLEKLAKIVKSDKIIHESKFKEDAC